MLQRFGISLVVVALTAFPSFLMAQNQAPGMSQPAIAPPPALSPTADLRQALSQVQSTTADLEIRRWKTSGGIRQQTQDNVDSIQHDLAQTLPGLLATADAAPESVPPSFAVYRNVDALYDVLLRVSAVADFAAPRDDAEAIAGALQQLASARSRLGDTIQQVSLHHEQQIQEFRTVIRAARTAAAKPERETVIDDGPVRSSRTRMPRKRKEVQHKPEAKPAAGTPKSAAS